MRMGFWPWHPRIACWGRRPRLMLGLLVTLGLGLKLISSEYSGRGLWFLAAGAMVLLRPGSVLTRNTVRPA